MCYIAVADRFTRTEITYIQVTLPPYLKLRDVVKIYLEYLYISCQNRVCIPIFSMLTVDLIQYVQGLQKLVLLRCWGRGAW